MLSSSVRKFRSCPCCCCCVLTLTSTPKFFLHNSKRSWRENLSGNIGDDPRKSCPLAGNPDFLHQSCDELVQKCLRWEFFSTSTCPYIQILTLYFFRDSAQNPCPNRKVFTRNSLCCRCSPLNVAPRKNENVTRFHLLFFFFFFIIDFNKGKKIHSREKKPLPIFPKTIVKTAILWTFSGKNWWKCFPFFKLPIATTQKLKLRKFRIRKKSLLSNTPTCTFFFFFFLYQHGEKKFTPKKNRSEKSWVHRAQPSCYLLPVYTLTTRREKKNVRHRNL